MTKRSEVITDLPANKDTLSNNLVQPVHDPATLPVYA